MPASFALSQDRSYLIETLQGQHTSAMQRSVILELFDLVRSTGVTRVLVDARQQRVSLSTMEKYQLWDSLALQVPRGTKFAIVVGWQLMEYDFIETVAVNRGVNAHYFNNYDQALAWLGVRPDGA